MPKAYYIEKRKRVYIKDVDYAKGTITFTNNEDDAMNFRGGYYGTHVVPFLQAHFEDAYPQVSELKLDSTW